MSWFLGVALGNSLIVAPLAGLVLLFSRLCRRPALVHFLWVIVLLKLITPPLLSVPVFLPLPVGETVSPPTTAGVALPEPNPSFASEQPAVVSGPLTDTALQPSAPSPSLPAPPAAVTPTILPPSLAATSPAMNTDQPLIP